MNRPRLTSWTVILGLLGALWFGADAALGARLALRERDRSEEKVREAYQLGTRHSDLFSGALHSSGDVPMKTLVQEAATKEGIQIAFLTESDKDMGKGKKEKQISARFVRSPHAKLVSFFADIEARGGRAKVKELHLRPSKEQTDAYEEAEILYSRITRSPEAKP
jgi:hypothetical protein